MMTPMPGDRALSILAAAEDCPDAVAIVSAEGSITFGELARRARPVMRWLSERDDAKSGIALVATLRIETILVFQAAFALGLPVFVIHPRLTAAERQALVETSGVPCIDESWNEGVLAGGDDAVEPRAPIPDEAPLAILFTSGSSGTPKGVILSRRAFLASAAASAQNFGWQEGDRWLLSMPLGHVGGLSVVVRCLIARKTVVLLPWAGEVRTFLERIDADRVTILSLVPTMLRKIFDEVPGRPFAERVRVVMLGGDGASAALLDEAATRGVPALTTYGLTEACSQVATQTYGERPAISAGVGKPLAGVEVRIVSDEIHVRGPTLMSGYFPEGRTPSPFLEGGWLPTGDLGEIDERGRLHLRGRRTEMIITGGENVYPREVEQVLARFPGIADVCVFGVADERWGQIVAAALVPADPAALPSREALRAFAAEHLAAHRRPRAVAFCPSLPLNATGKVDRKRTAAELAPALSRL